LTGCFRTRYINLYSDQHAWPSVGSTKPSIAGSWQNFWIFGWLPAEKSIESNELCSQGVVQEIETRQTFLQGLVAVLITAVIFIPIYAPWDGQTICYQ
jgi:hypothetical protein